MKLSIAALSLTIATTTATLDSNSASGRNLLSKARRLDGGNNGDDGEYDTTWMQNYSLKFQGCRTALSYNDDADGDDDVKVATTKLAHFRLCASDSCTSWNGGGCNSGYGDYVVDLAEFAEAFVQGQRQKEEYECQMFMFNNCDCNENDDKDDGFNREYCEYDCYAKNSKMASKCIDRNPYEEEQEGQEEQRRFEAERYVGCQELEIENNGDDGNAQVDYDEDGNAITYYVGSTCSDKGDAVYLAVYTDDTCTIQADTSVYKKLTGTALPYSASSKNSLITTDCVSCVEQEDPNRKAEAEANGEYYYEELKISDACTEMYEAAGKCETNLAATSKYTEAITDACSYIAGIKISRSNGVLDKSMAKGSKVATAFIVIFGVAFVGLAGFVYTLHKKIMDAKKAPLLD